MTENRVCTSDILATIMDEFRIFNPEALNVVARQLHEILHSLDAEGYCDGKTFYVPKSWNHQAVAGILSRVHAILTEVFRTGDNRGRSLAARGHKMVYELRQQLSLLDPVYTQFRGASRHERRWQEHRRLKGWDTE